MTPAAPVGRLTRDELNRATLARQFLLERTERSAFEVIEHLIAMQSQVPGAPFTGLWSRIADFDFVELDDLMLNHSVVRMLTLRSTVHLMSAVDAAGLRPLVQVVLDREYKSVRKKALDAAGVDPGAVAARARELLSGAHLSAAQIADVTHAEWPEAPREHVSAVPRLFLPTVQVTPRGLWGQSGQATFALFEDWTGLPLDPYPLEQVVLRYLAAYGPATVMDAQKWCGLTRLKAVFEGLGDALVAFEGPSGERLYDLPDAPRPAAEVPAPVRILPEYDNVGLAYVDRTRIVDPDRQMSLLAGPQIIGPTVLVDGRTEATVRVERDKTGARLLVRPFTSFARSVRDEIEAEAGALLEAMGDGYAGGDVEIGDDGSGYALGWA